MLQADPKSTDAAEEVAKDADLLGMCLMSAARKEEAQSPLNVALTIRRQIVERKDDSRCKLLLAHTMIELSQAEGGNSDLDDEARQILRKLVESGDITPEQSKDLLAPATQSGANKGGQTR